MIHEAKGLRLHYPAGMGFNRRRIEDELRDKVDAEPAAMRAPKAQVREDAKRADTDAVLSDHRGGGMPRCGPPAAPPSKI